MKAREVTEFIAKWLDDYAADAGIRGFVVGVSGGIDSAITSTLAAMTGRALLAVEMPIHQATAQKTRAHEHIGRLQMRYDNVSAIEVDLTSVLESLTASLPKTADNDRHQLSLANTRARLRMTTLYYFATLGRDLVVGTGNKVEDFGVGFYTKHGDGGVDVSPIADLTKTEVYTVAHELEICDSILSAPPTDGLWSDDRTDEDQIGATYPELEWAMEFTGDESALEPRQRDVLAIYRRFNAINRHKMNPTPVCIIPPSLR